MRRLAVAFVILSFAAVLAACGDTGDHFLDFAKTPPSPALVTTIRLTTAWQAIPRTQSFTKVGAVTLQLISNGQLLAPGTQLANPVHLQTNYDGFIEFGGPSGPFKSSIGYYAAPGPITLKYTRPPGAAGACFPPGALSASTVSANPPSVSVAVVTSCPSSLPSSPPTTPPTTSPTSSPTTKPTKSPKPTPTPSPSPSPEVAKISLAVPGPTPNALTPGTFTMTVTAFNSAGQTIPPGTTLTQPIELTTNSSCTITYSFAGSTGSSLSLTTAPGSVTLVYSPPSATCTPPNQVLMTAYDLTAVPQTTNYAFLGGTATVTGLSLTALAVPNPDSIGIYPLFVTASASYGTIPLGIGLTNPVQFSSNFACGVDFGVTTNPGTFTPTYRMTSTQTQVYFEFNPTSPTSCPPPSTGVIVITALSNGSPQVSATYSFPY
jgi:hypothetical protein